MKESNERKARQPKMTNPMTGALWVGVALSLLAFALYVSAFVVQEEMLFFPCFLFGVFGNIITAFSGHGRREYNIALNQEGRFKWFDRLLFLGMGVANVIFTFHTLENLASFLFVGFLLFMFLVSGIACFWQAAEAFLTDHPLENFGPIAVILSALGIVCAFFYRVYVFVPLVVFSIETSGTAILLFGKAVKHSEPPQRRLREILFAFSLVSFLLCIFLIMQTVQNVDEICMDVYFVVQTAAYVVLFIRSLFFAK
jgi:energy-converting hydrogenase Eha subunit C